MTAMELLGIQQSLLMAADDGNVILAGYSLILNYWSLTANCAEILKEFVLDSAVIGAAAAVD